MLDRQQYERFRVSPVNPATIRVSHVEQILAQLAGSSRGRLRVEKFAESFEGRPIFRATIGGGPRRVLLWSQMHGDEPTHTAVLFDLLSYFLKAPAEPLAAEILAGCTLEMLPLLNPDGAERFTRFNAQGIDINRDAVRLSSPEARALRQAVEAVKPQFAFNLHNQNARTSVSNPPKPAAVAVLAPPPSAGTIDTPHLRRAKQMAACFVEAVRPFAEGMISRYDDEFEPRAFGDTIQARGAVTMLVEAGGWPEANDEPMVRLHFHGMLATLHAVATDRFQNADLQIYESLPQANSRELVDLMTTGARVLDERHGEPYVLDLGINYAMGHRLGMTNRDGRIGDVGDLSTTGGKMSIDASNNLVLPGRIALVRDWHAGQPLPEAQIAKLLASGVTSAIGLVDLAKADSIEASGTDYKLPFNWGFIGRIESASVLPRGQLFEHVALAASRGLLAVAGDGTNETFWQQLDQFRLPLVQLNQLPVSDAPAKTYRDLAQQSAAASRMLKLNGSRGRVSRGQMADLQLIRFEGAGRSDQAVDSRNLERMIVGGETVWQNSRRVGGTPGALLKHA